MPSTPQPNEELHKAIMDFRKFCFKYRDDMYQMQKTLPTRPLREAQDTLERRIDQYAKRQVVEELKKIDPIASHKLAATVEHRIAKLEAEIDG